MSEIRISRVGNAVGHQIFEGGTQFDLGQIGDSESIQTKATTNMGRISTRRARGLSEPPVTLSVNRCGERLARCLAILCMLFIGDGSGSEHS